MKETARFMAFFVISSFVIPFMAVYFGRIFEYLVKIIAGMTGAG